MTTPVIFGSCLTHGAEAPKGPTLRNTVFNGFRLKTIGEGKKTKRKKDPRRSHYRCPFGTIHTFKCSCRPIRFTSWMGGIQGFPPFVHTTHSQDSATTNHVTTSSDHDFFTFLSFFRRHVPWGNKWLGATDGGAGSSMMMMKGAPPWKSNGPRGSKNRDFRNPSKLPKTGLVPFDKQLRL